MESLTWEVTVSEIPNASGGSLKACGMSREEKLSASGGMCWGHETSGPPAHTGEPTGWADAEAGVQGKMRVCRWEGRGSVCLCLAAWTPFPLHSART